MMAVKMIKMIAMTFRMSLVRSRNIIYLIKVYPVQSKFVASILACSQLLLWYSVMYRYSNN